MSFQTSLAALLMAGGCWWVKDLCGDRLTSAALARGTSPAESPAREPSALPWRSLGETLRPRGGPVVPCCRHMGWCGGSSSIPRGTGSLGCVLGLLLLLPAQEWSPCRGCLCQTFFHLSPRQACRFGSTYCVCVGRDLKAIAGECSVSAWPCCGRGFGW